MTRTLEERLMKRVVVDPSGCWLWTGAQAGNGWREGQGYGVLWAGRRTEAGHPLNDYVHRVAYELFVGPIPEGLEIDHLCRTRNCVNPAHLEVVDHRENQLRGQSPCGENARRTHCIHGHEFDAANTRVTKHGKRHCRRCDAMRASAARARRAKAAA